MSCRVGVANLHAGAVVGAAPVASRAVSCAYAHAVHVALTPASATVGQLRNGVARAIGAGAGVRVMLFFQCIDAATNAYTGCVRLDNDHDGIADMLNTPGYFGFDAGVREVIDLVGDDNKPRVPEGSGSGPAAVGPRVVFDDNEDGDEDGGILEMWDS